jgi:hypothetical protein
MIDERGQRPARVEQVKSVRGRQFRPQHEPPVGRRDHADKPAGGQAVDAALAGGNDFDVGAMVREQMIDVVAAEPNDARDSLGQSDDGGER